MAQTDHFPDIHVAEDTVEKSGKVFNCQLCGECCTSVNIPIETEKSRHLLAQPWVQARLAETGLSFLQGTDDCDVLPMTSENACIFLQPDAKCMIEVHEGRSAKPEECQRFPFASVCLPDGTTGHDISAGCKTVAEIGLQSPLPMRPGGTTDATPQSDLSIPKTILARPGIDMTWQHYLEIQQQWLAILTNPAVTPAQGLQQVYQQLLTFSGQNFKPTATFQFHPLADLWIPKLFLRRPYGLYSFFRLLSGRSYQDPKVFGQVSISLAAVEQLSWQDPAEPHDGDIILKNFIATILQRKVLLAFGHSLLSLTAIASTAYFLVHWYAKALAHIQGNTAVTQADVVLAIRLTERYYTGHQPRFLETFRTNPWIPLMMQLMMKK